MISYDQYENRIKKYAKFRNFMKRFKFLFIAIFALIIAAIATLLALKGSFSGEIKITSSVYGESYSDPEGVSAFLSSVSYEYAREGSDDWSSHKPVKAGKYSVRAVSDKTIGKGYGKVAAFEIAPREVTFTIQSDSVEYGGVPDRISLELLAGDTLDKNALLFKYGDYAANSTAVDLDESSVKITNGTDDRSSCYTVIHEEKKLDITPRRIGVSLQQCGFVYSGRAISYSATASFETETRLANGDVIRFGAVQLLKEDGTPLDSAPVNVGHYSAGVLAQDVKIYKVIDGKEIEVTNQYELATKSVPFAIERKPITVTTASAEKEYDGTPLQKPDGYRTTGLVDGDTFTVTESASLIPAKSVDNEISSYEIKNSTGVDTSANYEVFVECGTLTVKRRKMTVTSPGDSWEYDGTRKSLCEVGSSDALFKAVEVATETIVTTVGSYPNVVGYEIRNLKGEKEDKANFDVTEQWGTLQITPRAVTVKIEDMTKTYDGIELKATPENGKVTATGLAAGDTLASGNQVFSITDAQENVLNTSEYSVMCGREDRTKNYTFEYARGTLTVTKRTIRVVTATNSHVYTGEPYSDTSYTATCTQGGKGLIGSDKLTPVTWTSVTNVNEGTKQNVCTYSVSSNYEIVEVVPGSISVTSRPIRVVTTSATKVYDGTALSKNDYANTYYIDDLNREQAGLVNGDTLSLDIGRSITNVRESGYNTCTFTEPNDNYTIIGYDYGTLTVTPRTLRVKTASAQKVYDGIALSNHKYDETYYADGQGNRLGEGLLGGDALLKETDYPITEVKDTGDNRCTFSVPNDNYTIIGYDFGTLTITPRTLRVETASATKEYDGIALSNHNYDDTYYADEDGNRLGNGLLGGDALIPKDNYSITNVRDSGDNKCTFSVPNGNYAIIGYDYGTLTVTKKSVTVQVQDVEATYGEDYKIYPDGNGNFANPDTCGFVGSDTVKLTVAFDLSSFVFEGYDKTLYDRGRIPVRWNDGEVGGYEGAVKKVSARFDGSDIGNYNIEYKDGTLYIVPRILTVVMRDVVTFYGEDLNNADGSSAVYPSGVGNAAAVLWHDNNAGIGLFEGDTLEIKSVRYFDNLEEIYKHEARENFVTPRNQGFYGIKPYEILIYPDGDQTKAETTKDEDNDNSQGNYSIQYYSAGELTIKPRPIEVTLKDVATEYYDGTVREYPSDGGETIVRGTVSTNDGVFLKKPDALVYGEVLNVKVFFDDLPEGKLPKYAGQYTYSLDLTKSTVAVDGVEMEKGLENYAITCHDKTLEITKRPITLKMHDLGLVYGDSVQYPSGEYWDVTSELTFVDGDFISGYPVVDFGCGEKPSVGTYTITGSHAVIINHIGDDTGEYSAYNSYKVTYKPGTLTVSPKDVNIKVINMDVEYGETFVDRLRQYLAENHTELAYGETLTFDLTYLQNGVAVEPRNVGLYDVQFTPVHSADEARLNNYRFDFYKYLGTTADGEEHYEKIAEDSKNATLSEGLRIRKLPITVTVEPKSVVYGDSIGENSVVCDPKKLPYGESLDVDLICEKDGKPPKYVGTYEVVIGDLRIVGNENGINNYDVERLGSIENGTLTITPRPISVKLDSLTVKYGETVQYESGNDGTNYTITSGELVYGDELFVFPNFREDMRLAVDTYAVGENREARKVLNKDGAVTDGEYPIADNYSITIETGSTLTVIPREIVLTLNTILSEPIYYDGEAHDYARGGEVSNDVGDGMAEGEELVVAVKYFRGEEPIDAIAKAGQYRYEFDWENSYVLYGETRMGLGNYTITGTLSRECEILKREIEVTLLNLGTHTYGEIILYPDQIGNYESLEAVLPAEGDGLVTGETLKIAVDIYRTETDVIVDGGVLTAGDYYIQGKTRNTVLSGGTYADIDNYTIRFVGTAFKVEKKKVTVTVQNVTADYGETPVYPTAAGNYAAVEGLAVGDTLTVGEVEFTNGSNRVGTYEKAVKLVGVSIKRGGKTVTDSYTVESVNGDLTIRKRSIIVTTATTAFVYDGKAHSYGEYTISYKGSLTNALAYDDTSALSAEFVGEGKLPSVTEVRDSGEENDFKIIIKNGEEDVSGNYNVQYTVGKLTVSPRKLYITTSSADKVYDGEPLTSSETVDECYSMIDGKKVEGLVAGHYFTFTQVSITNVDSIDNNTVDDIKDASGVSQKDNYEFAEKTVGKLTVYQRIIYVDATDYSFVYDGKPHTPAADAVYTVSFYDSTTKTWLTGEDKVLVAGHSFFKQTPTLTDAKSIKNNPYKHVVQDGTKSGNYEIISNSGWLTVTQRPVSVTIADVIMTYCNAAPSLDPVPVVETQNDTLKRGVLTSDAGQFSYGVAYRHLDGITPVTRYNAGSYLIDLTYTNSEDKENYNFIVERGNLTIEQANLTLRPGEKREYYESEDQEISIGLSDLIASGLASGDTVTDPGYNRTSLKASENRLSVTVKIIKENVRIMSGYLNVKDNYVITVQSASIGFIKRTIYYEQIVPDDIEKDPSGRGLLPYTGERQYIEGGDNLFHVLTATEAQSGKYSAESPTDLAHYGMLDCDKAVLKSAYVSKSVQVYGHWAKINVVNGSTGNYINKLYNIVFVSNTEKDSSIEVLAVPVTVSFSPELTDYINGLGEGITLLGSESGYFTVNCGFLKDAGHTLEAAVCKADGVVSIYIFIYEKKYDESGGIKSRADRSSIYQIQDESGIGYEVQLVSMSYYPTGE